MIDQDTMAASRLDRLPRLPLCKERTALHEISLPILEGRNLRLFLKRDDLGVVAGGGNKLRKLEYLLASAKANGVDTLITYGAVQSNHARLTAAVAAQLGMRCELVLSRRVPNESAAYAESGNVLLAQLFGARLHVLDAGADPLAFADALQAQLLSEGRTVQIVPFGGSNSVGALGMVRLALETVDDLNRLGLRPSSLVTPSGSGGTQAGLLAGIALAELDIEVHGISVLHDEQGLRAIVDPLVDQTCHALGISTPERPAIVDDRYVGPGYGVTYPALLTTIETMARSHGLLLDPVYTGKGFHGLLTRIEEGRYDDHDIVVYMHTGGLPGLFAYRDTLADHLMAGSG